MVPMSLPRKPGTASLLEFLLGMMGSLLRVRFRCQRRGDLWRPCGRSWGRLELRWSVRRKIRHTPYNFRREIHGRCIWSRRRERKKTRSKTPSSYPVRIWSFGFGWERLELKNHLPALLSNNFRRKSSDRRFWTTWNWPVDGFWGSINVFFLVGFLISNNAQIQCPRVNSRFLSHKLIEDFHWRRKYSELSKSYSEN